MSDELTEEERAKNSLQLIRGEMDQLRKSVSVLAKACEPPAGVEKLTAALRSILGNVNIVLAQGEDPKAPLLPWIKQRCETALQTRVVTERVGECLGPIDWAFDFTSLDWGTNKGGINPEHSARTREWLKEIEAAPQTYIATTDGGSPKVGWKRIIQVGMYDGWPFWKPIPSVQMAGALGAEWHPWYSLSGFEKM